MREWMQHKWDQLGQWLFPELAAAEKQLAEMQDASEELEGVIFGWLLAEDGYDEGLIESCAYRLRNARLLSEEGPL